MTNRRSPRAQDRRVLRSVALGAWALTAALGCAHFEPTLPLRARTDDVDLQLRHVSLGSNVRQAVYASRSTKPHEIAHAWLTVATRVPCTGGLEAAAVVVDDGAGALGVLPPGEHELRARFESGADDMALDLVLDVEVEDGVCLRAPAVSQSIPFEAPRRFVLATSLGIDGNADLAGLRSVVGLRVGGGGWVGPVLATAVVGLGASICNEGTCGRDSDNSLRSGLAIPAALDLRYSLGTTTRNRVTAVYLVGARYSFMSAGLPALDGDRRFAVHGFQGVLGWALSDAPRGPFLHRERTPLAEFAVPVGVYWSPDAPAPAGNVVFAIGLDFRFLVPL
jgi:hypothetical protein